MVHDSMIHGEASNIDRRQFTKIGVAASAGVLALTALRLQSAGMCACSIEMENPGKGPGDMVRRLTQLAVVMLVALLIALPAVNTPGHALDVPAGPWEGEVIFGGALMSQGVRADGTDFRTVRTVDSSDITFEASVAANGDVINGTMTVDISWSTDGTGTTPATFDLYHVTSTHREFGTLTLGGGLDHLVAAGTLTSETHIFDTQGNYVEEASGVRMNEVSWVFSASSSLCAMISGGLSQGEGISLLNSATIPHGDDDPELVSELFATYYAWPDGASGADELADSIAQLVDAIQQAIAAETPSPDELASMVLALEVVRNTATRLEGCDLGLDLTTDTGEDALAVLMNELIAKTLEQADQFSAQELIQLLNIGVRSGAVTPNGGVTGAEAVYDSFGDALFDALETAIAADDGATILDIAIAAAQYGFDELHQQAVAAHEEFK